MHPSVAQLRTLLARDPLTASHAVAIFVTQVADTDARALLQQLTVAELDVLLAALVTRWPSPPGANPHAVH